MVIQVPARVYYALFRLLRLFTLHCTRKRSVLKGEATQQTGRSVALDLAGEVGETYLPGSHVHDHGLRAEFEAGSEPLPEPDDRGLVLYSDDAPVVHALQYRRPAASLRTVKSGEGVPGGVGAGLVLDPLRDRAHLRGAVELADERRRHVHARGHARGGPPVAVVNPSGPGLPRH